MNSPESHIQSGRRTRGTLQVVTDFHEFATKGHGDIVNVTEEVRRLLNKSGLAEGSATMFVPGATGALTTLEFEPGVLHDFCRLFDEMVPSEAHYEHNVHLGDGNGHSHVRAGLLGPSLVIPFSDGRLLLGTWQEICFLCFDNRPRDRRMVAQFMGV